MSALNDNWRQQTKALPRTAARSAGSRAAHGSARKAFNPWDVYRKWWKGKTTADGMLINDIVWHGPPSGVYGTVELLLANGTSRTIATNKHRPSKCDVKLAPNDQAKTLR